MKKNSLLSIGAYTLAFLVLYVGFDIVAYVDKISSMGGMTNAIVRIIFFAFILLGIFFGYKSNKAKESSWGGNLLMAIGILFGFYFFLLIYAGLGAF